MTNALFRRLSFVSLPALLVAMTSAGDARAITYDDVSQRAGTGLAWRRAPSATKALWDAVKIKPFMSTVEKNQTPLKWRGQPGVAILDYDNDGDLDIYVTNGPGRANSLFQNQLAQTGTMKFVDVAVAAGVDATSQDSTGVCFGDIDNDGDEDILVLGRMEPNRLFENNGNGRFTDITARANVGGGALGHTSCSMGDIDNDGLVDIFVANTFDWSRQDAIFTDLFAFNHKNQLYRNKGSNKFVDVSEPSNVTRLEASGIPVGDATISWATALVDFDLDGDVDVFHTDDQAAMPPAAFGGKERGYIQLHKNDGRGNLTNATRAAGFTSSAAEWMGIAFGDLNSDGFMDLFAPAVGGWLPSQNGFPVPPAIPSSRWWLGGPGGTFVDSHNPPFAATPFGWGCGMADYDNDGDTDIIFYGNLDQGPFITADNPGVVLANDGNAGFGWDRAATERSGERTRRSDVHGMALGDLNGDGFVDIVHASGGYAPNLPLLHYTQNFGPPGSFNDVAEYMPTFFQIGPNEYEWSGQESQEGILGVQISSADNDNNWVKVKVFGTIDMTSRGKVNRDGIGAVIKFTPDGGRTVMAPVLGGSSHASQHSLTQGFGLGNKTKGVVEILWPGGVKNRFYDAAAGESLVLPEIPCDYARTWSGGKSAYMSCVNGAVNQLYFRDFTDVRLAGRLRASASRAYDDAH